MTATVHILHVVSVDRERVVMPCRRCGGLRRVTFDQMNEAQQRWAPLGAVHPCPDCGEDSEVIPLEEARQARASGQRAVGQRPEEKR